MRKGGEEEEWSEEEEEEEGESESKASSAYRREVKREVRVKVLFSDGIWLRKGVIEYDVLL